MANSKRSRKGLKICCGVTAIFLITLLTLLIVLFFTLFKPKDPKITTEIVTLEKINVLAFPIIELNVTLGLVVTVDNPNYGSFKHQNSTAYVSYRGIVVAEAPIEDDKIPARRKHDINTSVTVFADKLVSNSNFLGDFFSGILNFTSTTTLHGKVSILKYIKRKATSHSTCDISVFVQKQSVDSVCKSKIRL